MAWLTCIQLWESVEEASRRCQPLKRLKMRAEIGISLELDFEHWSMLNYLLANGHKWTIIRWRTGTYLQWIGNATRCVKTTAIYLLQSPFVRIHLRAYQHRLYAQLWVWTHTWLSVNSLIQKIKKIGPVFFIVACTPLISWLLVFGKKGTMRSAA